MKITEETGKRREMILLLLALEENMETKEQVIGYLSYYPNLYAQENGSGINTTITKTDGIERSESYYSTPTTETSSQAKNGLTITNTYYYLEVNKANYGEVAKVLNDSNGYWIASRCIHGFGDDHIWFSFFELSGRGTCSGCNFCG